MANLDKLLTLAKTKGALELYLTVKQRPKLRLGGEMVTLAQQPVYTDETLREHMLEICPSHRQRELQEKHETQFGYGVDGVGRFRCHYFLQRTGLAAVFRSISDKIPSIAELGLPAAVESFAHLRSGLVLVVGGPRSGKTTTLAALVNVINHTYRRHVLCLEDPIEYIHPVRKAVLTQREVGLHCITFRSAVRSAVFQDCEVLAIGELPDSTSISLALEAADRGILVLASMPSVNVSRAIERCLDTSIPEARPRVCSLLGDTLQGVVSLTLLTSQDGKERYPVPEVLRSNPAVAALLREGKLEHLPNLLSSGRGDWYLPADTALQELAAQGRITAEDAYLAASVKGPFERLVSR